MSLNIAARALTTNQSVLQVIGHNISNANTVGYSRQSVSLDAVAGQKIGNGYFGKGVELTSVKRSYDAFLTKQANSTATVAAGDEVRYQKMQQIEALFPLGEGSLGTQLNNALNAWVDVQASPADSTARQVVIDRADEFAARIRDTPPD
jgi:flagellar hook-associated protein 1 FlgK